MMGSYSPRRNTVEGGPAAQADAVEGGEVLGIDGALQAATVGGRDVGRVRLRQRRAALEAVDAVETGLGHEEFRRAAAPFESGRVGGLLYGHTRNGTGISGENLRSPPTVVC